MRKTPTRRSGRLQATEGGNSDSDVGEEDSSFLQPRSSIRAHRDQQLGPTGPHSSPAKETPKPMVKEEAKAPRTRSLRGVRQKTPESSDSENEAPRVVAAGGTQGSVPRILLQRVRIPFSKEKEEEVDEEKPEISHKNDGTKVAPPYASRVEPKESELVRPSPAVPRKKNLTEPQKVEVLDPRKQWTKDSRFLRPAAVGRSRTPIKPKKTSFTRWICYFLLPCLLLLPAAWYLWKLGCPMSLSEFPSHISFSHLWGVQKEPCTSDCSFVLVESIPDGLTYDPEAPVHMSVYQSWMDLMDGAQSSVDIAAFYFTLQGADTGVQDPSSEEGEKVLQKLMDLSSRGVKLNIAVNGTQNTTDLIMLTRKGAEVKFVNFESLLGGVLHTKLWVVDKKHIYIGSANMDWRALTQVKELGAVLYNCSCLAHDLRKIFQMYSYLGEEGATIPSSWPNDFSADSSLSHPQHVLLNGSNAHVFISSSPDALCAGGRSSDLDSILATIDDAKEFIYISVMDYLPRLEYSEPKRFWPVIDNRLRSAACDRRVTVKLLISCWPHSKKAMFVFMESLEVLSRKPLECPIEVKLFVVSATEKQKTFPFSRVNHNKYMVTDRIAYIDQASLCKSSQVAPFLKGTSNWSEDYFLNTAGVGLIINQTGAGVAGSITAQGQLKAIFQRDWNSQHTQPLSHGMRCASRD
ncbi:5'-3' exonuclease PLD3-like isoform X2 [Pleurodeles waltl]|uniref:5'-3' exonuclease PLD3-like isoform X2 n=1 Tax=Pleurodeles waltl TaxID=8319 RepID=UPI0037098B44